MARDNVAARGSLLALLALAAIVAPLAMRGQQSPSGRDLYRVYCAGCHGARGEGGRGPDLTAPRLKRAPDDQALARVIGAGIPGTEMPPTRILGPGGMEALVAYVRSLRRSPEPARGDPARGRELYRKADCASCHAIGPEGGVLLDLSEIGARRGASHLRQALLEPEAYVPESFGQYRWVIPLPDNFLLLRVVTREGRALTGMRLNEDAFSIQLRDLAGQVHSFWKSELAELHKDWGRSPMPSYKDVFSREQIEDLVAYLASLKGAS
jgi:putative heme-binding domain-containing protein